MGPGCGEPFEIWGSPLWGLLAVPNGYLKHLVPASMIEGELCESARWRRQALMMSARSLDVPEEEALVEATASEVSRGLLQGPYTEDEMIVLMGSDDWTLNPRFVLLQRSNNKVRVTDDAKQVSVNASYSFTIKLQLQEVDYAASMAVEIMHASSQLDAQS